MSPKDPITFFEELIAQGRINAVFWYCTLEFLVVELQFITIFKYEKPGTSRFHAIFGFFSQFLALLVLLISTSPGALAIVDIFRTVALVECFLIFFHRSMHIFGAHPNRNYMKVRAVILVSFWLLKIFLKGWIVLIGMAAFAFLAYDITKRQKGEETKMVYKRMFWSLIGLSLSFVLQIVLIFVVAFNDALSNTSQQTILVHMENTLLFGMMFEKLCILSTTGYLITDLWWPPQGTFVFDEVLAAAPSPAQGVQLQSVAAAAPPSYAQVTAKTSKVTTAEVNVQAKPTEERNETILA